MAVLSLGEVSRSYISFSISFEQTEDNRIANDLNREAPFILFQNLNFKYQELPLNIHSHIFCFLNLKDIGNCAVFCKKTNLAARSSTLAKEKLFEIDPRSHNQRVQMEGLKINIDWRSELKFAVNARKLQRDIHRVGARVQQTQIRQNSINERTHYAFGMACGVSSVALTFSGLVSLARLPSISGVIVLDLLF